VRELCDTTGGAVKMTRSEDSAHDHSVAGAGAGTAGFSFWGGG
jgi:hypothetical protein